MADINPTALVAPAILNGASTKDSQRHAQQSSTTESRSAAQEEVKSKPPPSSLSKRTPPGAAYPAYVMPANLPRPPFIDVDGVANFRSLGGYRSTTGNTVVRPNLFYRCAHPMQITLDGLEQLTKTLGVKAIYDLRSGPEVTRTTAAVTSAAMTAHAKSNAAPSALPPTLPCVSSRFQNLRRFTPVFATEDTGPDALARKLTWYSAPNTPRALPFSYSEGFVNAYRHIAIHGVDAYTTIFRHILNRPTDPFVFHCTAGKDRTGVFAALLFRLAGIDDDTICWEYSLTEPGLGPWRKVFIERMCGNDGSAKSAIQRETTNGDSTTSESESDSGPTNPHSEIESMTREEAARVVGSRSGNMRAFLILVLDGEFGGAEKYVLEKCGFSEDELQKIKSNLVVGLDVVGEEAVVRPCSIDGWTPEDGVVD